MNQEGGENGCRKVRSRNIDWNNGLLLRRLEQELLEEGAAIISGLPSAEAVLGINTEKHKVFN